MTSQWAPWRLKSPAFRSFAQPFVQAQIKENIKAPLHWPVWGELPVTGRWHPLTNGQLRGKCFHLMTSSCYFFSCQLCNYHALDKTTQRLSNWNGLYAWMSFSEIWVNILRPRQNVHDFADDIFKCIFVSDNAWIAIKTSLKFVPKGLINNMPALVQIITWRRPGDMPWSEPIMVSLLTYICITRRHWVKTGFREDIPYRSSLQGINKIADGNWSRNSFWMRESES